MYLIYIGVTLLLTCISGQYYGHYGMILFPALSYPLARVIGVIDEDISGHILAPPFAI